MSKNSSFNSSPTRLKWRKREEINRGSHTTRIAMVVDNSPTHEVIIMDIGDGDVVLSEKRLTAVDYKAARSMIRGEVSRARDENRSIIFGKGAVE